MLMMFVVAVGMPAYLSALYIVKSDKIIFERIMLLF